MRRLLKGGTGDRRRLAHTVVATALAVSLLTGTLLFTDTIRSSFRSMSKSRPGSADLMVRATAEFSGAGTAVSERDLVPESLVTDVRSMTGVDAAWGVVWGLAQPVDADGRSMGTEGRASVGTGWTAGTPLAGGRAPSGPGEIVMDAAAAGENGVEVGDRVKVVFQESVDDFTVVGLRQAAEWQTSNLVNFDPQVAEGLFGRGDGFDAVAVTTQPRVSNDQARLSIGQRLPERYEVVTADQVAAEAQQSWIEAVGFVEVALLAFAAVALLVGGFVIANTFTIVVGQRTRELALLRALGASRRQVMATVLVEAAAAGTLASALGIVGGLAAARGLLALMSGVGLGLGSTTVVIAPATVLAGMVSGVSVTAIAALLPAWRASRLSVADGIAGVSDAETTGFGRRAWVGGTATVVGAALLATGLFAPVGPRLAIIGLAAMAVLVGLFVSVPLIARPVARVVGIPMARIFGASAVLGRENAMRNPRRTGATAAALTIGICLVGVTGILAASVKASAEKAVTETLRADFVIKAEASNDLATGLPPLAADRLRATPGVDVVSQFRMGRWGLRGHTQTVLAVDPATLGTVHEIDAASRATAAKMGPESVIVRASTAARHGWRIGDRVPMTFARTGTQEFRLAGTFSSSGPTDYVVSLAAFEANYTQQRDSEIRVRLAPGTSAAAGRAAIESALSDMPDLAVMDRSEVLATQQAQVDRVLMPVAALLALSVVIALIGIANTLALSIHERTREIGLLRSIGMARHQLRAMIRSEAVIIAALGALLGVAVAALLGWAVVSAMRGVGVTVLVLPLRQLAAWVVVAVVAGLMAAILPARRAAALPAMEAVGTPLG